MDQEGGIYLQPLRVGQVCAGGTHVPPPPPFLRAWLLSSCAPGVNLSVQLLCNLYTMHSVNLGHIRSTHCTFLQAFHKPRAGHIHTNTLHL